MKTVLLLLLLPLLGVGVQAQPTSQTVVAPGTIWKFFNQNGDLGTAWRAEAFSDAAWASGPSPLGYSPSNTDGANTTVCNGCIDCAENCPTKRITTYFRHHLNLSDASGTFAIRYQRDDGIVIYVNGTEVHRENLPATTITYSTTATAVGEADEATWITVPTVSASLFHTGDNVIAVEIHQTGPGSSDIRFNMEVVRTGGTVAALTRGPYLQMGTPTEMTLRWRSSSTNTGRVRYWTTTPGSQTINADESTATTEHEKRLTGLAANTRYNYTIGGTDGTILQSTADNYFYTAPLTGTTKKTRIWALGDFGKGPGTPRQANVKNQFLNYVGSNYIDMWLWLGDNAYNENGIGDGTELEYQTKVFDIYGPDRIMRQTPVYATPGNHDYASNGANHAIAYFDILSNFKNAEGGGVASGKEEYYSFNHGNIHVVSLDSYGHEPGQGTAIFAPTGPQITWLKSDLAAAKANPAIVWVIVFTHYPPYTKGTHDSDDPVNESELFDIRQRLVPVLDQYKVDMLITGHSHVYERSKLMKNYTGLETDFNPAVHNAPPANNEPTPNYYYKSQQASVNEGVMYIVDGTGGANGGISPGYPHNAMDFSINQGGSLYLEIDGAQLDGKFIGDDGLIKDQFTMIKTDPTSTNTLYGTSAGANLPTTSGQNTLLGYQAGNSTTSSDNTFVGYRAGYYNTTGGNNVFSGTQAGYNNTTGSDNVFSGFQAGYANQTGVRNTFLGTSAGVTNTGSANTFLGYQAGQNNQTGGFNVFIGLTAGLNNTNGFANLFLGQRAGFGNSSGQYNTFIGSSSGEANTVGANNNFIGNGAGLSNTEGNLNVFIGSEAGSKNRRGGSNVGIGTYAGKEVLEGSLNTFIGHNANVPIGLTVNNATAIGANAQATMSNVLILGNNANVGIGTSAPANKLEVMSPSANTSGLRLTNLKSSSPATIAATKYLTVDANGDVVLGNVSGSGRIGAENWTIAGESLQNTNAGSVIIGQGIEKTPAGYKLFVEEGILTEKVKVAVKNTADWSDKVFAPGYRLTPLSEVEQYIKTHQHLPGILSAEQVVKEGMDVAKMNAKLLEKIEELTLYVLTLNKEVAQLRQQQSQGRDHSVSRKSTR